MPRPSCEEELAKPHGPRLGHPGGFTLTSDCSACIQGGLPLFPSTEGERLQTLFHFGAQLPWGQGQICPGTAVSLLDQGLAVLALGGPHQSRDWGAPGKAGPTLGAFGPSRLCSDKLPKVGGQGILVSGRRPGCDVVLWGGAGGQELMPTRCPPSRHPLPGPLSGGLHTLSSGGQTHPFSEPLGAAGTPPAGPCSAWGGSCPLWSRPLPA